MIKDIENLDGWNIVGLPDIVFFQEGPGVRNNQYTDSGVKLINVANLKDGKVYLENTERYISEEEAYGRYRHFLVDEGDLIIASSGIKVEYFDKKMGFINKEHLPLCMNTSTIRFKTLDENILDIKYFAYFLKTIYFKKQIARLITGSAQLNFGPSHLKKIKVILPPLNIQKKIVEVLEKSQYVINKRSEQIEELELLVKSKFIEMFGNPITNSKGWNIKLLGEVCEMKAGKNIKSTDIYEKNNGKLYPCYGGNGLRGYVRDYSHDGNIPLIGRQGALCGNVKYAKGKFYATEHAVVTNPKIEMNTYWLYYILEQLDLNRLSTGAAQPGLTVGKLKEVKLPIAPIGMQNDFENFAKQVDKLKFEIEQSLKELEDNFNSLMQKAFKGELFN
ncbi:MAG: restriction endonuclease subunit S [Clostridium perfringens]|nr:restriction endonuclease subunit S [Clostridium perfringens]